MAVQKPQGSQVDIQNIASDLAADTTAIGSIASGLASDPGAQATLDAEYVRRDGSTMTGLLVLSADPSAALEAATKQYVDAVSTSLGSHTSDATIHFTEASIDHANILNIGTNTHAQIDTHIGDATVHFTEASIDHANILSVGTNTHAQIDTHIADTTVHYTMASISITKSQVSDFSDGDYATAAQGTLADTALQAEVNDLTAAVTWANVPDANITQTSVTQHQAALSITQSQISDLGPYEPAFTKNTAFNKNFGTGSTDVCVGDDARLSDARAINWSSVPTTATDSGTAGDVAYDGTYLYVCVASNTWMRVLLSTW